MVSVNFLIKYNELDDYLSISPEYYQEKFTSLHSIEGVKIKDIVHIISLTTNRKHNYKSIVLDTSHTSNGIISYDGDEVEIKDLKTPKKIAKKGDVIISRLRPYLRQVGYVDEYLMDNFNVEKVFTSTEYYILSPINPEESIAFLVPFLLSDKIQETLMKSVEGGHHPRFKEEVLKELIVPGYILDDRMEISYKVSKYIEIYRKFENLREQAFAVRG